MSTFPKTDYARAKRQVHEQAWQQYLKTQQPADQPANSAQSKIGKTIGKLLSGH